MRYINLLLLTFTYRQKQKTDSGTLKHLHHALSTHNISQTTFQCDTYRFSASKDLTLYSGDFGSFRRTSMSLRTLTNWLWRRLFIRDTSAFDGAEMQHNR